MVCSGMGGIKLHEKRIILAHFSEARDGGAGDVLGEVWRIYTMALFVYTIF